MRNWVQETHGLLAMGRQLAAACEAVVSGERW
jgi:hypothetical protein